MEFKKQVLRKIEEVLRTEFDEVRLENDILLNFLAENIADHEEWKAIGQVLFMPYVATEEKEEILKVYLTVARNVDTGKYPLFAPKLLELNAYTSFGQLGCTPEGEIYYQACIPIVGESVELAAKTFEFVTYEMFTFLDAFYPYILVLINEPDKLTLSRYMELMLEPEDEE